MNEKGSILTTVLLLAGLLILLALPVLQVANAGYKTSVNEQVRTQAFYLAEAGLEHSKQLALGALQAGSVTLPTGNEVTPIEGAELVQHSLASGVYNTTAVITHVSGNKYEVEIVSTASVNGSSIAQRSRSSLLVSISANAGGAADKALYSHVEVTDFNKAVVESYSFGPRLPLVPPPYDSEPTVSIGSANKITKNGYYQGITLKGKTLEITTTAHEIREVRLEGINLENGAGDAKASILVTGGGRLRLYVDGNIFVDNHCVLIDPLGTAIVEIYCSDECTSVELAGPRDEDTPVFTRTLLYAPYARLSISNLATTRGAIVVDSVELDGNGNKVVIAYDEEAFGSGSNPGAGGQFTVDVESFIWSPR